MKIINNTHWQTKHLRVFLTRAASIEEIPSDRMKQMIVTITYARPGRWYHCEGDEVPSYVSGKAMVGGTRMWLHIPKGQVDKVDLAHTAVHEFGHIRGMEHSHMRGRPQYRRIGNWRELMAWGEFLPLDITPPKVKKTVDVQQVRYARVMAALSRWETKLKRAQTALKTYRQKQRYYERQFAIAAKRRGESK